MLFREIIGGAAAVNRPGARDMDLDDEAEVPVEEESGMDSSDTGKLSHNASLLLYMY